MMLLPMRACNLVGKMDIYTRKEPRRQPAMCLNWSHKHSAWHR
jgi:hypothetical protein